RMRHVKICAVLLLAAAVVPAASLPPAPPAVLTVILNFTGNYSAPDMTPMQQDVGQIIKDTAPTLNSPVQNKAGSESCNDLVVMTFKVSCVLNPMPPMYDELGPYAITRTTGGEIQPFGEVDCDHVVSSLHSAMNGDDYAKSDLVLGRALGRVVAHELVHM